MLRGGKRILTGDADAGTATKTRGRAKLAAQYPAEMQFETIQEATRSFVRQVNERKKIWDDAKMESWANAAFDQIDVLEDTANGTELPISTYFNSVDYEVFASKFCEATMNLGKWQVKDQMYAMMFQSYKSNWRNVTDLIPIICSLPSFSFFSFLDDPDEDLDSVKIIFCFRLDSDCSWKWEEDFEIFTDKFFMATLQFKQWKTRDEMFLIMVDELPMRCCDGEYDIFESEIESLAKKETHLVKTMTRMLNDRRVERNHQEKEIEKLGNELAEAKKIVKCACNDPMEQKFCIYMAVAFKRMGLEANEKIRAFFDNRYEDIEIDAFRELVEQEWAKQIEKDDRRQQELEKEVKKLKRDVQSEKERRLVCEESLTRCVQELRQARAEIRDLQMRD